MLGDSITIFSFHSFCHINGKKDGKEKSTGLSNASEGRCWVAGPSVTQTPGESGQSPTTGGSVYNEGVKNPFLTGLHILNRD